MLTLMVVAAGGRESSCSSTAKLSGWYSYEERGGVVVGQSAESELFELKSVLQAKEGCLQ